MDYRVTGRVLERVVAFPVGARLSYVVSPGLFMGPLQLIVSPQSGFNKKSSAGRRIECFVIAVTMSL